MSSWVPDRPLTAQSLRGQDWGILAQAPDHLPPTQPLTEARIREARTRGKPFKLSDARGLFLLVAPAGGKWWRFRYRFGGKHKSLSMGVYPETSLEDARNRRDEARRLLSRGIDPGAVRREDKARQAGELLAMKNSSTVQVSVALDGAVEIWKGRAVVRLTSSKAREVNDLLTRISSRERSCD